MSFLNKEERLKCWGHRDEYWQCLDQGKSDTECNEHRKRYEQFCPSQWVKHFDRKREYLKFREQIEKQGDSNSDGMKLCQDSEVSVKIPSQKRHAIAFRVKHKDPTN
ncbi:cytochrome c oxidase assembly factor 6 homolog [Orussus abietinus]|uniref:cytochrome c oxidase assembly factor 6 homolog n=1 Tax=Orussus abietinus TaxID=222816 RepID=UPI000624FE19|nr:cytochrome c oxidase assembly factor 6 homolog [Orussus abietinus]XP_012275520.1 cytochrome c oxidase assembly factor 6 homolog [Orussus abietinus]XP_012275522.1 cytochrome c oxidase assembly factor 6 homolog [Orussus abietinus]XP_012275523.1 cytochrome c oxidase assembly factor 6 homolog [Orussus abietinus]XP_012275524.1 cytochrome c oxidase assembly factor 6 homolog [Orussus abietinus]XP_023290601.1 cytochrome c oxidase assembly factor 6 homolog [Orussus abietinus]